MGYWPISFFACLRVYGQYPATLTEKAWSMKDSLYRVIWLSGSKNTVSHFMYQKQKLRASNDESPGTGPIKALNDFQRQVKCFELNFYTSTSTCALHCS